jgi:hypothetical protein
MSRNEAALWKFFRFGFHKGKRKLSLRGLEIGRGCLLETTVRLLNSFPT